MSDKTLSKNLIAAGLFDVAYSADITDDTSDTMIELFRFCAIGLEHAGIDVYELLEELVFDTEPNISATKRTGLIMKGAFEKSLHASEAVDFEVGIFSEAVARLVNLQLSSLGCEENTQLSSLMETCFISGRSRQQ